MKTRKIPFILLMHNCVSLSRPFLCSAVQLRRGKWPGRPVAARGRLTQRRSRAAEPAAASRVVPLPVGQRLRDVAQVDVAQQQHRQRKVCRSQGHTQTHTHIRQPPQPKQQQPNNRAVDRLVYSIPPAILLPVNDNM